jgi:hypothetical protein
MLLLPQLMPLLLLALQVGPAGAVHILLLLLLLLRCCCCHS